MPGFASGMSRRRIIAGRILRIASSGGSVNSSVVSTPTAIPCAEPRPDASPAVKLHVEESRDQKGEHSLHRLADHARRRFRRAVPSISVCNRIDADDVARSRAQRFHHRDVVHLLLQVRVHGHRHADRADDHRDQADQTEKCRGAIQPARDDRMDSRKSAISARATRSFNAPRTSSTGGAVGLHLEQDSDPPRGCRSASGRCAQRPRATSSAQADVQAARHAVGLADNRRGDAESRGPDAQLIADIHASRISTSWRPPRRPA